MAFRNPITKQASGHHEWSLSCNENPQLCKPYRINILFPKWNICFSPTGMESCQSIPCFGPEAKQRCKAFCQNVTATLPGQSIKLILKSLSNSMELFLNYFDTKIRQIKVLEIIQTKSSVRFSSNEKSLSKLLFSKPHIVSKNNV